MVACLLLRVGRKSSSSLASSIRERLSRRCTVLGETKDLRNFRLRQSLDRTRSKTSRSSSGS